MNWAEEIGNSLRWLAIAFVVSSIAFFVIAYLIGRFTQWGREFLRGVILAAYIKTPFV